MDKINFDATAEELSEIEAISKALQNYSTLPLEQEEKIKDIVDTAAVPAIDYPIQTLNEIDAAVDRLTHSSTLHSLGEMAIKFEMPTYQFESPALKAFEEWNNTLLETISANINSFLLSPIIQEFEAISSSIGKLLQEVDFSPLTSIIERIQSIGFDCNYEEVNEVFLKAMFDAKWFPYAGWVADFRIVDGLFEILDTSRASKNRVKRIDKLIFSYYNKTELDNLKRGWRMMNLPSYMIRILVQSVQAYHRREYALTVSALSTLWEGIIQEKVNDGSYRISRKTRENLTQLIEENEFDKIFSSFCEEFIFYNCTKPEDVKPDVPGRHGIAHGWYDTYPNRKVALNAILFTDFLLGLEPLDNTEEE